MINVPADNPVHLLLVEDEPSLREAMALILELEGYRVTPAADGLQALERLVEDRPDVIVTDHMMPGITGLELTRRIRADAAYRAIPLLMLSATPLAPDEQLADVYLQKPVRLEAMLDTLQRLLDQAGT